MAKVILSLNDNPQGEFDLAKDRMTIGRKSENDIPIDNLAISGQHALILTTLDDSFVEDLGSTNGTYVNGRLIKKQILKHGDIINIGKHELKYIGDQDNSLSNNPVKTELALEKTEAYSYKKMIGAGTVIPARFSKDQKKTNNPSATGMPEGKLHILNGPIAGKQLILSKTLITLGKPGVQVAVISRRSQGYFLSHIEGTKDGKPIFPEVNGESIGAKAYQLGDNDILELAGIKMEFTLDN